MIWAGLGPPDFLDFDDFLNSDTQDLMDLPEETLDSGMIGAICHVDNDPITSVLGPTESKSQPPEKSRPFESDTLGTFWHGSPIKLLNSTALTEGITKNLCQVYDTMLMGLASRYLSYVCNQFAGAHGYIIEPENPAKQITDFNPEDNNSLPDDMVSLTDQQIQAGWGQIVRQSAQKPIESFRRITLIGVARFLDNFATLYGNKLDQKKRQLDEATFTAVLQAFALQFASSADQEVDQQDMPVMQLVEIAKDSKSAASMSQVFTTAWFNAHSYLVKSNNHRSFMHIYSVFLFHMTAKPDEAFSKDEFSGSAVYFLDHALYQLKGLTAQLSQFCSHLESKSLYRTLLESSQRIFHWFGYVRDTMESLISERSCILDDLPMTIAGRSQRSPSSLQGLHTSLEPLPTSCTTLLPQPLEDTVAEISQQGSRCIFSVFRQTSRLNSLLHQQGSTQQNLPAAELTIESLTKAVDAFYSTHGNWMEQCLSAFLQLSTQSKQFVGLSSFPVQAYWS
ncbi:hypothetical protein CLAIMM_11285 [Cladophialophora immunda]|nr:hypothetical protein CLAIMM_11285 [Cladophialophora immunda]